MEDQQFLPDAVVEFEDLIQNLVDTQDHLDELLCYEEYDEVQDNEQEHQNLILEIKNTREESIAAKLELIEFVLLHSTKLVEYYNSTGE